MAENAPQDASSIRDAASETVRQGTDIRAKVHELTLLALQRQRFDRHGIREVVRAVTEGIAVGADKTTGDMRLATSEALRGLDQALRTSAEAGDVALKQLAKSGRSFSDAEFKQALANLRKLEDDFLKTAEMVADAANARVQPELREALRTARRTGTETGKQVALTMGDFAQKFPPPRSTRPLPASRWRARSASASRWSRAACSGHSPTRCALRRPSRARIPPKPDRNRRKPTDSAPIEVFRPMKPRVHGGVRRYRLLSSLVQLRAGTGKQGPRLRGCDPVGAREDRTGAQHPTAGSHLPPAAAGTAPPSAVACLATPRNPFSDFL
jgi:hypothetical protein